MDVPIDEKINIRMYPKVLYLLVVMRIPLFKFMAEEAAIFSANLFQPRAVLYASTACAGTRILVTVLGNPYHSPSGVAGGVTASTMTSLTPVLSKAEKLIRTTRDGIVSLFTF